MSKPIYILGAGLSHDGSTCLMKDGQIIVAIEKERLTKIKHDGFNDNATVQYCLEAAGITFKDIDLVVEENDINLEHDREDLERRKGRIIPKNIPTVRISHHLAHAYSAIGTSPFDEMGIVVMDGRGSSLDNCIDAPSNTLPLEYQNMREEDKCHYFEKESYYVYKDGKLKTVFKDFSRYFINDYEKYPIAPNDIEHSIAELYGGASRYVFKKQYNEGKLMGLAPYGRPNSFTGELFILEGNRVFINYETIENLRLKTNLDFWDNFQYFADLAYWVQSETERSIKYLFCQYYKLYPMENVAYAGGLALNAVCNGKLLTFTPFKNLYIQPAAADNGLSIGCCYYGWMEVMKKERVRHNGSTYFGKVYSEDVIRSALKKYENCIVYIKHNNYIKATAKYLEEGKVVAWFQDGSEFGPRALGNRSILADPRRENMRDYINHEIKLREEFRPFAPSVLLEDVKEYFDLEQEESPYMILVGQTKPEWRQKIPSVVHVDGSARIQTVTKELTPKYYELLKEFKKLTGISVLLNTSLNCRGMPIVETPEDALQFFCESKIDVLVIHDYIVLKPPKTKGRIIP